MHISFNFRCLLAICFLAVTQFPFAEDFECFEPKLALLDQNLAIVQNLLKIRHELVLRISENPTLTKVIDDIDGTLLLSISTTTLKEAFGKVYSDDLAKNLYGKNAREIMRGFCEYRPKIIKKYQDAMKVILADCNNLDCEKCDIGI